MGHGTGPEAKSAPEADQPPLLGKLKGRFLAPHTWDSRDLFGDQFVVHIRHMGEIYRLQSTRQGKLILTK